MQKALDVSNYTGPFTPEVAHCWRERGFSRLIAGTQRPEITRGQLESALEAGLQVEAYVYLYWRFDTAAEVRAAIEAVSDLPVQRLWLDCEDSAEGFTPEQVLSQIGAAVSAAGSIPAGIYTGRWWWRPATADSVVFASLPLWHAEYTPRANLLPDFAAFEPYGGWSRPRMWQYQGTTSLCGVNVDLNLLADETRDAIPDSTGTAWDLRLMQAARRFERALLEGRYALRPVVDQPGAVELVRVEAAGWRSFEPPYVLVVD